MPHVDGGGGGSWDDVASLSHNLSTSFPIIQPFTSICEICRLLSIQYGTEYATLHLRGLPTLCCTLKSSQSKLRRMTVDTRVEWGSTSSPAAWTSQSWVPSLVLCLVLICTLTPCSTLQQQHHELTPSKVLPQVFSRLLNFRFLFLQSTTRIHVYS